MDDAVRPVVLGLFIVLGLVCSNVLTQQLAKTIFHVQSFDAPLFLTSFTTLFLIFLHPVLYLMLNAGRIISDKAVFFDRLKMEKELFKQPNMKLLVCGFCILYVLTNYLFISSLRFISNTEAATYLATDPAICFILAFCLLDARCGKDEMVKNGVHLVAAVMSFAAITLSLYGGKVADEPLQQPSNITQTELNTPEVQPEEFSDRAVGALLAISATFGAAFYKTIFARYLKSPETRQVSLILSLIGVGNLLIVLPVSFVLIHFGIEDIDLPSAPWGYMVAMSCTGVMFNFLINWGVVVTYPLFISVGFSLCLPGNLIVDYFLRGAEFTGMQLAGTAVAFLAVLFLLALQYYLAKQPKEQKDSGMYSEGVNQDAKPLTTS